MKSIKMTNPSRTVGVGQDEYKDLDIVDLPVEDSDHKMMLSLWQPSAEEREILANGGVVQLYILGNLHPPVMVKAQSKEDTWRLQ